MGKVRVSAFSVSLDGFAAGPGQDLQHPFGVGADEVPAWLRKTQMFHKMIGQPGGATGIDNDVAQSSMENHRRFDHGPKHVRLDPRSVAATMPGKAGGDPIRHITCRCSC